MNLQQQKNGDLHVYLSRARIIMKEMFIFDRLKALEGLLVLLYFENIVYIASNVKEQFT